MLNQVVIVGRIVRTPELKELNDEKNVCNVTLAVPRSFKNAEGEYETDFVNCSLWNKVAENAAEYLQQGDLIGVKGRIASQHDEKTKDSKLVIVAEKVTYLSKSSQNKEQDEVER